ncbi:and other transporter-domain-containing protein [Kockovaella imperatae]|uniref:And other transporter-domain-containing protein n=1 Tax=Kockovaella imperatae TaxID=4999 RepID=A0A1Y1UC76_9TREE|nr:and other transporter-domain-containing protein [Kockovaella imperatae]ORX35137.1 and other transporter-domain-containing protein [Kockovaella imperatae]
MSGTEIKYERDQGEDISRATDDSKFGGPQHDEDPLDILEVSGLEARQTALELAMQADPGPDWKDWRFIKYCLICALIFMAPGDWGFDGTVVGSINSMEQYQSYFDLAGEASTKTGVVLGIGAAGTIISFVPSYVVPDRYGRRWAMSLGNIPSIISAFMSGFAPNYHTLLAARIIGGLGFQGAAPAAYLAEITPPKYRGRVIGAFDSMYYIGQIIATGICIPFGRGTSNWAWRVPFCLQAAPLLVLMAGILFCPESPRWLYAHGQEEKALRILADLHSRDGDINSPLVQLEMQEIRAQISQDGADTRWWDFRSLFNTRANTYRFLLGVVNLVWSQFAGNGLVTNWLPELIRQAGITDTNRQRQLTFANAVTSFAGAMTGVAIVDHVGRRGLMLWAAASCGIGMAICAGLLSDTGPKTLMRTNASIAFIMLFMVCFSIGWTPLQQLYPTEVLSYENRQKGNALRSMISILINSPALLTHIQWKTYIIFVVLNAIGFVLIYVFAVETKQLSLEDLDEVFESRNPKKTSLVLVKQAKRNARQSNVAAAAAA